MLRRLKKEFIFFCRHQASQDHASSSSLSPLQQLFQTNLRRPLLPSYGIFSFRGDNELNILFYSSATPTESPEAPAQANENRRKAEDKLAGIFLFIILSFVLCHLPRVALDVHEIATLGHYNKCRAAKIPHVFPAWSFVAINISHFCLVLNATMNMFIYCSMSTQFREEFRNALYKFKARVLRNPGSIEV